MTTLTHRLRTEPDETRTESGGTGTGPAATGAAPTPRRKGSQADGMAVASFVLGLVGLLVMNLVLGPLSLILGAVALHRRTARRGRALLGMTLGAADLIVLAAVVTVDGTVSWSFA
ncbi:DUF4190 domain-containing protein [Streptomyces sclerotialus]|uniref:DUF4190 domain-containing protein n=1 Tax=Streptomyces sclerotialus TaxID=1957 RepID=UPI0004CC634A